ncbi:MAG: single-stranded DNA-binding protein [Verrucomicrobiales bacterium]|nr:single-stranded DNA-binding protein [Verrucomicrobiales bacterium]
MEETDLEKLARRLSRAVGKLQFSAPVHTVYNPLDYAWAAHQAFLRRFGTGSKAVVFLGMNPGPFGMAQTGVPFGEVAAVRDWMGLTAPVKRPVPEHPKRPIQGFDCPKSEVSGRRLWGLFAERFGSPEAFFERHFVVNYCPLVFMSETGANITPDKLPAAERAPLEAACDAHLAEVLQTLQPEWVIGVGGFAEQKAAAVRDSLGASACFHLGRVLHPSPASPAANRGWAEAATKQMLAQGVW